MKSSFLVLFSIGTLTGVAGCDGCKNDAANGAAADAMASVDAGPTAPLVKLDVSNASPRAWTVETDRFPAISDDGNTVALFVQKEDGTRMYPNAAVEIRTVADDKTVATVSILEAEGIVAAEGAPDAFDTTLPVYKKAAQSKADEAVTLLSKTKWSAVGDKTSPPPRGDAGAPPVIAAGFTLVLRKSDKLSLVMARLTDKDMTTPLLTVDASTFEIPERKTPTPQKGNPTCVFTPYIAEAAVDAIHHALMIRIAQTVRDNVWGCFEPSQWHVYKFNG